MKTYEDVYKEIEHLFSLEGRKVMLSGETDEVWIFRGTFIEKGELNTPIIVDKKDGSKRFANNLYDEDIFLHAKLIEDNRNK